MLSGNFGARIFVCQIEFLCKGNIQSPEKESSEFFRNRPLWDLRYRTNWQFPTKRPYELRVYRLVLAVPAWMDLPVLQEATPQRRFSATFFRHNKTAQAFAARVLPPPENPPIGKSRNTPFPPETLHIEIHSPVSLNVDGTSTVLSRHVLPVFVQGLLEWVIFFDVFPKTTGLFPCNRGHMIDPVLVEKFCPRSGQNIHRSIGLRLERTGVQLNHRPELLCILIFAPT
jgi:hypothetical protein